MAHQDIAPSTPPAGYVLVTTGPLRRGDRVWDVVKLKWTPQQAEDIEILGTEDASIYAGVARKQ